MEKFARDKLSELGLQTIQNIGQAVETLSGGQRQGVAVARAAAFGSKVIIMDEPTAALGVEESRRVLDLILDVRSRGIPIVLISHNMPHVFEVADRIHVHRLGATAVRYRSQGTHDVGRGRLHDRRKGTGDRRSRMIAVSIDTVGGAIVDAVAGRNRILVGIAGPPGAGKSTLSSSLLDWLNQAGHRTAIVPMDGFHLDNSVLLERGLLDRKGAPETFDVDGFIALVETLRGGSGTVAVPVFDRNADKVRDAGEMVPETCTIVLLEGNYLLLDRTPWTRLVTLMDLTVFVTTSPKTLRQRLVQRWLGP